MGELTALNHLEADLIHEIVIDGANLPVHQRVGIRLPGLEIMVDDEAMNVEETAGAVDVRHRNEGRIRAGSPQHLVRHIHRGLDIIRA